MVASDPRRPTLCLNSHARQKFTNLQERPTNVFPETEKEFQDQKSFEIQHIVQGNCPDSQSLIRALRPWCLEGSRSDPPQGPEPKKEKKKPVFPNSRRQREAKLAARCLLHTTQQRGGWAPAVFCFHSNAWLTLCRLLTSKGPRRMTSCCKCGGMSRRRLAT